MGDRQGEAVTGITRTSSDLQEIKTGALVGPLLLRWGAPWSHGPRAHGRQQREHPPRAPSGAGASPARPR